MSPACQKCGLDSRETEDLNYRYINLPQVRVRVEPCLHALPATPPPLHGILSDWYGVAGAGFINGSVLTCGGMKGGKYPGMGVIGRVEK